MAQSTREVVGTEANRVISHGLTQAGEGQGGALAKAGEVW